MLKLVIGGFRGTCGFHSLIKPLVVVFCIIGAQNELLQVIPEAYFAGDYALEYVLTADRRLKVRLYYRNEETIEGRKNKTGIGLAYRREFDSFIAWLKGEEKDSKRAKKSKTTVEDEESEVEGVGGINNG